ncbi:MAG TPA: nucleotidyltransferase family protein [Anaerolineae bacterium]|nr:nucleotidyltransferase family protein [Anaerolineae bacterium]
MNNLKINLPEEKVASFCRRWKITELALFGSVLRDDFGPDSDVDVLVTFAPDAPWSLVDHVTMQDELKQILQRNVDLISRRGLEQSHNSIRRKAILSSAQVFYAA